MLTALCFNCYSQLFNDPEQYDYTVSYRVSYPSFLSVNTTVALTPGGILCRGAIGINASKIGIGLGSFDPSDFFNADNDISKHTSVFGASLIVTYLKTYDKKNAKWVSNDILDRSFLGIELNLALFAGIDIGAYYSIDTDKKGIFLFVFGIGLFY